MPTIQPVAVNRLEKTFKAQITKGSTMSIRLAKKENGFLKSAHFSKSTLGNKEELVSAYLFGNHSDKNSKTYQVVTDKISEICDKAKEGAKLFADIMGWIK